jgi:alkylation response protein AidB-like acyl-CoA dehydrogenase
MSVLTSDVTLEAIGARFAAGSADVDSGGTDVRDGLRWLAGTEVVSECAGDLPRAVEVVEHIAGECLSSAFSLWAHLMVLEYLRHADTESDHAPVRAALEAGELIGSTAMAPALRDVAGLEPVPVLARHERGGLRLTGPIRWASNLFDDSVLVLPVRFEADDRRAVVRLRRSDAGVGAGRHPELLALNGTASGSLSLDEVLVAPEAVLAHDLPGFVARIRPAFLIVQSAFCAGLAHRCVDASQQYLHGPNAELTGDVEQLGERVAGIRARLRAAAGDPGAVGRAGLLRLRLEAAGAAADATRLESTVRGGAGYVAGSEVSRRLREGAFLPIQAPTEGQLRWELSRCA